MTVSNTIQFAHIDEFLLDPLNPRLGKAKLQTEAPQQEILEELRTWNLEELATSFLESGFWPQEAVIAVRETIYGTPNQLVVVEGNRRIAALKFLDRSLEGTPPSRSWRQIAAGAHTEPVLFSRVPYIMADSRDDVIAFLGFRHVTGIKEWNPAEKAEFISRMIAMGKSYDQVRRQIGSRIDTVKRNYVAHQILQQLDVHDVEISELGIDRRFSVLFLSLREGGVRTFLGIEITDIPEDVRPPVPDDYIDNLIDFSKWLFGTNDTQPLFRDSRDVGSFAKILSKPAAVDYLRSSPNPNFDLALQKAGVEDEDLEIQLKEASNQMELALSRIHLHLQSSAIHTAMRRLALNARELVLKFPDIADDIGLHRN